VVLTWRELEDRLRKLTHDYRDSGDRIYTVTCSCGTVLALTKVGRHRGSQKEVGAPVFSAVARQLKIQQPFWRAVVDCTKARTEYLAERGHSGRAHS
jgi:hypothetical protein